MVRPFYFILPPFQLKSPNRSKQSSSTFFSPSLGDRFSPLPLSLALSTSSPDVAGEDVALPSIPISPSHREADLSLSQLRRKKRKSSSHVRRSAMSGPAHYPSLWRSTVSPVSASPFFPISFQIYIFFYLTYFI